MLAGTSKNRVTYDSLSTFQWMSGFCSIIREQSDVKVKNAMLGDHTTNGQLYTHICAHCVTLGKRFPHALKDCRNKKENQSKNE